MFAGVASRYASAASASTTAAVNAGRTTTSTDPSFAAGSRAPANAASSSSCVAGEGVWWTTSRVATPRSVADAGAETLPRGRQSSVMTPESFAEILDAAQRGDEDAFAALFRYAQPSAL